jgi:hypothetical protein
MAEPDSNQSMQLAIDLGFFIDKKAVNRSQIYISQDDGLRSDTEFHVFRTCKVLKYNAQGDDFGPLNLSCVARFITILDKEIVLASSRKVVYAVESGRRPLTNAVFLLGAYLIMKLDRSPSEVNQCFSWIDDQKIEGYRDATFNPTKFFLNLLDCWEGLNRSKELGWFTLPSIANCKLWGTFDIDQYDHFSRAFNGDISVVVPNKLIAFRSPKSLGDLKVLHNYLRNSRDLSPAYYADVFRAMRVSAVIQLNDTQYDRTAFTATGIAHHDLRFPDGSAPAPAIVARFLRIADGSRLGLVAIHCHAGLGRTGTLIALYLMRHHGFTARQAMAWLRIVRPGSVLGDQQHFLCAVERSMATLMVAVGPTPTSDPHGPARTTAAPAQPQSARPAAVPHFACSLSDLRSTSAGRRLRAPSPSPARDALCTARRGPPEDRGGPPLSSRSRAREAPVRIPRAAISAKGAARAATAAPAAKAPDPVLALRPGLGASGQGLVRFPRPRSD